MVMRIWNKGRDSGASYWMAALLLIVVGVLFAKLIRYTLSAVYRPEQVYFEPHVG